MKWKFFDIGLVGYKEILDWNFAKYTMSSLTGQLVNGTPCYSDKINEDSLSGQTMICLVNGCPVNGD